MYQERFDRGLIALFDCLKCDGKDASAVFKSVAMNIDHNILSVVFSDLPRWIWHSRGLVQTGDDINCLVVIANELTYRQALYSFVFQSADERGSRVSLFGLHFVELFRRRLVEDFHRFGVIILSSQRQPVTGVSDSAGCTLLGTAATLSVGSRPTALSLMLFSRFCLSVSFSSRTTFQLFRTKIPAVTISPSIWGRSSSPEKNRNNGFLHTLNRLLDGDSKICFCLCRVEMRYNE